MKKLIVRCTVWSVIVLPLGWASSAAGGDAKATTGARLQITGLHCAPCAKTVEKSLQRVQGVKSVKVDWKTKTAQVELDESRLPVQQLAAAIGETPHMMGGELSYAGWLSLWAEELKDPKTAKAAEAAVSMLPGIEQATAFTRRKGISILFSTEGELTTQEIVAALEAIGVHAKAQPVTARHKATSARRTVRKPQISDMPGMEGDMNGMDDDDMTGMRSGTMGGMDDMMCPGCMNMGGMSGMNGGAGSAQTPRKGAPMRGGRRGMGRMGCGC